MMDSKPNHKQNFLHFVSLGFGLLSIWPYILIWASPALLKINAAKEIFGPIVGITALFIAPCNGIPFGVAGVILGIFAFIKITPTQQKTLVVVIAIIGILISITGCISNAWYFSNLASWSSVPPQ